MGTVNDAHAAQIDAILGRHRSILPGPTTGITSLHRAPGWGRAGILVSQGWATAMEWAPCP